MGARPANLAIPSLSSAAHSAVLAAAGISTPYALAAPLGSSNLGAVSIRTERDRLLVGDDRIAVRYDDAFERMSKSIAALNSELQRNYDQLRSQVQSWNRSSLVCASFGFAIIVVAIAILIFGNTTTGIVTTAASVIPNTVAALFFVHARRADSRLDLVTARLNESREAYALIDIAETIEDVTLRNQLKAEIVRKRLTTATDKASEESKA